ncbi:hypothetical protein ACLOJK_021840 [Asimina triloba]
MEMENQPSAGEVQTTKVADGDGSHVTTRLSAEAKPLCRLAWGARLSAEAKLLCRLAWGAVEVEAGEPLNNGELDPKGKEKKEEEEETSLDGEFIKVEIEVKDTPQTAEATSTEVGASVVGRSASDIMANNDPSETEDKLKTLELEIERLAKELQNSESEKSQLKQDVAAVKEKLEERDKYCEELELGQAKLQEQVKEAEEKYGSQLLVLQEALGAQEAKHKELNELKEALDGLSSELESSRKRMQELEQEVESSAGEAKRFEELSKQSGSHAEAESQKAMEFERLLELTRSSAKEMEVQMASMQEELKGLHEKLAENQSTEESLNTTLVELSAIKGELELSKSQELDLQQKLSSEGTVISELTEELNLRKASEQKMKEDIFSLENLFTSAKEELQAKISNLEDTESKLHKEVKIRETVEFNFKDKELELSSLQEKLVKATEEKESLEAAAADLKSNLSKMEELCADLEAKLKQSDDNFSKTDMLLSQALSYNVELEEKIKSLDELHKESGNAAATATKRSLELEDMIRTSSTAEEEAKSQLRSIEIRLSSAEQRNAELEEQLNLAELKNNDADRDLNEFSEKTAELTALLKGVEEEGAQLKTQLNEYEDKIMELEFALNASALKNSELEKELHDVSGKCAEYEGQASSSHQRSLELEDLIQTSHSKAVGAEKQASELELLLEAANYRIRELEEQVSISDAKCRDVDAESKKQSDRVSELMAELEAFQVKSSSLEIAVQAANEKESQLLESLNVITEERKRFEDASNRSGEKLSEVENLLEVLKSELKVAHDKLAAIEQDLTASCIRENDMMEKLKSAEEKLEEQGKVIEQATARTAGLELLHESLSRDSELKLREATESFSQRDLEAKDLHEKLKALDDQYKEKAAEAAEREASFKTQLEESSTKHATLENALEELKSKISEAENKFVQSVSENELLSDTNSKLKQQLESHEAKAVELQELLSALHVEKEAAAEQFAAHSKTISELTDQHSRGLELQSSVESRVREAEQQLQEAIERFKQKDSEAQDLDEKRIVLETQVRILEEQANSTVTAAESQKAELDEALAKVHHLEGTIEELQSKSSQLKTENEGLAGANVKLSQELATCERKLNELQAALNEILVEKEETHEQLHSSKKTIEDLTQKFAEEGKRLQLQISSVVEENDLLNKTYQSAREELQAVITQMEGQLNEQMAREANLNSEVENLKAELTERSKIQSRITELEEQILLAETRSKEEVAPELTKLNNASYVESVRTAAAGKEAHLTSQLEEHARQLQERDALNEQIAQLEEELSLAHAAKAEKEAEGVKKLALVSEELERKLSQTTELEKKIVELENQLKLASTKAEEQLKEGILEAELKGAEVKSRDLASSVSTPSKRKSKKKPEAASAQAGENASAVPAQAMEGSSLSMNIKLILGVALVSVIVGVILGKQLARCPKITPPLKDASFLSLQRSTKCPRIPCSEQATSHVIQLLSHHPISEISLVPLKGFTEITSLVTGRAVHAFFLRHSLSLSVFHSNTLMTMYAKFGNAGAARHVFDQMPERNNASWNTIISGCVRAGWFEEAFESFRVMRGEGFRPNRVEDAVYSGQLGNALELLPELLRNAQGNHVTFASSEALIGGKMVHALIILLGFQKNLLIGNALVSMYGNCCEMVEAEHVFQKMAEMDVVTWNAMIGGHVENEEQWKAMKYFNFMRTGGVTPNYITIVNVLGACSSPEDLKYGMSLHGLVLSGGLISDDYVKNSLLAMYAKCGSYESSYLIFSGLAEKTVVSWNAMITANAHHGYCEEALNLFVEMRNVGLDLDHFSFSGALAASANLALLEEGQQLHNLIIKLGFESDLHVTNAAMDMYGKCGKMDDVLKILPKSNKRSRLTWNILISGFARQGNFEKAREAFHEMLDMGVTPDYVTFVSLLSACNHAGLVDDGLAFFDLMTREFGILPGIEHCVCIVDLLGRSGRLGDAKRFIEDMPVAPNDLIWRSLLAACRSHGNLELGRQAAQSLLEMDPSDDSAYVLLSNAYAVNRRWDDVEKLRSHMELNNVKKKPACSWIKVKNEVSSFGTGDRTHLQTKQIYAKLEDLLQMIKGMGYVADTTFVLHDTDDEQKEHNLWNHSEKLALAFGLISTPEGSPLRIFKNLRVCGDCHSAYKFISQAVGREIVLRDSYRFHHFSCGVCSCSDYW